MRLASSHESDGRERPQDRERGVGGEQREREHGPAAVQRHPARAARRQSAITQPGAAEHQRRSRRVVVGSRRTPPRATNAHSTITSASDDAQPRARPRPRDRDRARARPPQPRRWAQRLKRARTWRRPNGRQAASARGGEQREHDDQRARQRRCGWRRRRGRRCRGRRSARRCLSELGAPALAASSALWSSGVLGVSSGPAPAPRRRSAAAAGAAGAATGPARAAAGAAAPPSRRSRPRRRAPARRGSPCTRRCRWGCSGAPCAARTGV